MADLVHQLNALLRTIDQRLASPEEDLSASETLLLVELLSRPAAKPSSLADRVELSRARVTQILKRLQSRGLVQSQPDSNDRRSLRFMLTPAGKVAAERGLRRMEDLTRTTRFSLGRAGSEMFSQQIKDLTRKLGS